MIKKLDTPVRRGILLAGGYGTRLHPLTSVVNKHLLPLYDKPMIYYPLTTLMFGGVTEFLVISSETDVPLFEQLLGDGRQWGISVEYAVQAHPKGIADAFNIGAHFIDGGPVWLMLGDNVFYGPMDFMRQAAADFRGGACIFAYYVKDARRYGVVDLDASGRVKSIEEKPETPQSNYAIPGLYLFDGDVVAIARSLKPSARGELEITDVILEYLHQERLVAHRLRRGLAWLDTGTPDSLLHAGQFIGTIEARQGLKIGCPEEVAMRLGHLSAREVLSLIDFYPESGYRAYLQHICHEK